MLKGNITIKPGAGGEPGSRGGENEAREGDALQLRLRRLLGTSLGVVGRSLSQGLSEGNDAPLRVLLMLVGATDDDPHPQPSSGPSGTLEPSVVPSKPISRNTKNDRTEINRFCLEHLVFEHDLLKRTRQVMLAGLPEGATVSMSKPFSSPLGSDSKTQKRNIAVLGAWRLALQVYPSPNGGLWAGAGARGEAGAGRGGRDSSNALGLVFVCEIMSVPSLPMRVGKEGLTWLLADPDRRRSFFEGLGAFKTSHAALSATTSTEEAAGEGERGKSGIPELGLGLGLGGCAMPESPVTGCSSEAFLLGNLAVLGTGGDLWTEAPAAAAGGGGGEAGGGETEVEECVTFLAVVTHLLTLEVVPDSLLTDRQAITWQKQSQKIDEKEQTEKRGGASFSSTTTATTAITAQALPVTVQDQQARLLVSDRWLRSLSAAMLRGVKEELLRECSEAERMETMKIQEASAAIMAAQSFKDQKEAANRWFGAKWADKLRQASKKWFNQQEHQQQEPSPDISPGVQGGQGQVPGAGWGARAEPSAEAGVGSGSGLINATVASRAAAMGLGLGKPSEKGQQGVGSVNGKGGGRGAMNAPKVVHGYNLGAVVALSELLSVMLRRWGSGVNAKNPLMQVHE
ncbi:unnamed protein product [Discosporangium mesarthrocarpum]